MNWTAWSGKSDWRLAEGFVKGQDDNKAQGWQAGLAADMGRFSIGTTISFPHRVMSSKLTGHAYIARRTEVTQQYNGGLEIGLGYHPWSRWTFGLGYGLQRGFDFKSPQIPAEVVEYPASFKVSTGVEYRFSWAEVQFPVYVGFQSFWLTKEAAVLYSYVQIPTPEEKRNRSHLLIGGTILRTGDTPS